MNFPTTAPKITDESIINPNKKVVEKVTMRGEKEKSSSSSSSPNRMSTKRRYHPPGPDEDTRGTKHPPTATEMNRRCNPIEESSDLVATKTIISGEVDIIDLENPNNETIRSMRVTPGALGIRGRGVEEEMESLGTIRIGGGKPIQESTNGSAITTTPTPHRPEQVEEEEPPAALDAWVVSPKKRRKTKQLVQANVDVQTTTSRIISRRSMAIWSVIILLVIASTIVAVLLLVNTNRDTQARNYRTTPYPNTTSSSAAPTESNTATAIPSTAPSPIKDETSSPTDPPTVIYEPPSERLEMILNILKTEVPNYIGTNVTGLDDPTSPQYRAAQWLADVDIEFDGIEYPINFTDIWKTYTFVSRYGLATFYYATGGTSTWTERCNFLNTSLHHCEWNCPISDIIQQAEAIPGGWAPDFSVADLLLHGDPNAGVKCVKYYLDGMEPGPSHHVFSLELVYNRLSGTIPEEFGHFAKPFLLTLAFNENLSGSIPFDSFPPWMALLKLPYNNLSGSIPTSISTLTDLNTLWLFDNRLEGSLPPQIGMTSSLFNLDISYNSFTSTIPSELQSLNDLHLMNLFNNSFSGTIPPFIFEELGNLLVVGLHENELIGTLPEFSVAASNLQQLRFDGNELIGTIPSSIGNLTALEIIDLSYNYMTGSVPVESMKHLSNLKSISLYDNLLTGPILQDDGILLLDNMRSLAIWDNLFSGTIGETIGSVSEMEFLVVTNNQFWGPVPTEIGQLSLLEFLALNENAFSGPVPSTLVNLIYLTVFSISRNDLTGSVEGLCGRVFDLYQGQGIFLRYVADCDEVLCPCCTKCCHDSVPDECSFN